MRSFLSILALLACQPAQTVEITEWSVPWPASRPRDPAVAPDGRIWFVGQVGHYVAVFDPTDASFRRFDLADGTGPHNVIVSDEGTPWYAGNRAAHIGRLDPSSGAIERIPMPDEAAKDPHTLVFDDAGHIWFTVQFGNFLGRLDVATEAVTLIPVETPNARPYGILVDPSNRPWAVLLGTNKLATVDPETLAYREIALPRDGARPRRIGRTSDGRIWYVDYVEGYLGAFDPATEVFEEWRAPSGEEAGPYAMAVDGDDRVWFVETFPDPNRFVGFDAATEAWLEPATIPSGGGTVRHMVFDAARNAIWFGTDTNQLGRADLP